MKIAAFDLSVAKAEEYDLVFVGIGYETRARHFAESVDPQGRERIALGFDRQKLISYEENARRLGRLGYQCSSDSFETFAERVRTLIHDAKRRARDTMIRIAVDITSLNRKRIAAFVEIVDQESELGGISVDFVYSRAQYSAPGRQPEFVTTCEPVSDFFAGWSSHPDWPLAVLIGLGYEPEKAIGILEFLEPGWTWALFPTGTDQRYETAVERANRTLLQDLSLDRRIDYDVRNPLASFTTLNSLVSKLKETARPILVPLGPKIFALNSMLVALANRPDVSVWRVSAGVHQIAKQRRPAGEVLGITVEFGSN